MTRIGVIWRNALEAVCPRCLLRIDIPRKSLNYKKKKETNNWRKDVLSTKRKVCVNITSKFSPWLSHSVSTSSFSTPAPYPPPCVLWLSGFTLAGNQCDVRISCGQTWWVCGIVCLLFHSSPEAPFLGLSVDTQVKHICLDLENLVKASADGNQPESASVPSVGSLLWVRRWWALVPLTASLTGAMS